MSNLKETDTTEPEACPIPIGHYDHIVLGHGSGGRLSAELIARVFVPGFGGEVLARLEDQATLPFGKGGSNIANGRLAFTTDAFVVRPIFFPGGDIGSLAVHGTVNDLVVGGATPLYLSAAFILEEGLPIADLQRIVLSMRRACEASNIILVTGDTKVVDRGKGDKIFITTSGVGIVPEGRYLSLSSAKPGDRIVVSGTIGDHGIAILSVREGLEFDTILESDTAPLGDLVRAMLEVCPTIRCMRDPTRGGVTSVLHELAKASKVGILIDERAIPLKPEVRGACELFGLDPLYVANEGKLIAVVPREEADALVRAMRAHPLGRDAAILGEVVAPNATNTNAGLVTMRSIVGGERVVAMLSGEQLPRIC